MAPKKPFHCPVCRAGFRGTPLCSRCGADLSILMTLAATACRMRAEAREAILEEDFKNALQLAERSQELNATEAGRRLRMLTCWLDENAHNYPLCPESATGAGEKDGPKSDENCRRSHPSERLSGPPKIGGAMGRLKRRLINLTEKMF